MVIRDEKEGQDGNLVYEWEAGDEARDRRRVRGGRPGGDPRDALPALATRRRSRRAASSPTSTRSRGQATIYMTSQAPHAHRTVFAMVAGLPEQDIRIISPDLGGGFGNKVPVYPGYVVATAASLLIGRPVKWVESRSENLISTGFARDYHMKGELALARRRADPRAPRRRCCRPGGVLRRRPADAVQGRAVPRGHRQLRLPRGPRDARRRVHQQGARRRRVPVLVPHHRGVVPDRAPGADTRPTSWASTRPRSVQELHPARAVPVQDADRVRLRLRRLPAALRKALDEVGYEELREEQAAARARKAG